MIERLQRELDKRKRQSLWRQLRPSAVGVGRTVQLEGREFLNFGSNDYLGLASHPEMVQAAAEAAAQWGTGSGGSRLLGGDLDVHHRFEERFAVERGAERALLFNSGYSANLAVVCGLASPQTTVFADRLIHASFVDAIRLSGSRFARFRHNNAAHLDQLLSQASGEKLVLVEALYSMDGDLAPLKEIVAVAKKYNAVLLVDEAHSDGVLGPNGGGLVEELQLQNEVDLVLTTFGKGYGSFGAMVSGSNLLIESVIQKGRPFTYTTALPATVVAASAKGVELAQREPWRRERALELAQQLRSALGERGVETLGSAAQIVTVVLGSSEVAVRAAQALQNGGIWAPAVREPTVPAGTARLRINLTASHTATDLQQLIGAIDQLVLPLLREPK